MRPSSPPRPVAGPAGWPVPIVVSPTQDGLLAGLRSTPGVVLFLFGHMGLALMMDSSGLIATGHALVTLALASYWAMQGREMRVAAAVGYIAGAETLWRMTGAATPWEFGKYAMVLVLLLALVRKRWVGVPVLVLMYLAFLMPSAPLAFGEQGLDRVRQEVSFNFSGPVALFVVAWFFYHLRIGVQELRTILIAVLAPVLGIAAIAAMTTASAESLAFAGASNVLTSGDFGPNQVASVLGLGIAVGFLYAVFAHRSPLLRWLVIALILAMTVQAGLTFSRSGLALASASTVTAAVFMLRNPRTRVAFIAIAVVTVLFIQFAMIPFLNNLTQGQFGVRFTDTSSTGRVELAAYDLSIWQDNFLLGVGPGQASLLRSELGYGATAHTEYTRVLSEHGLLGALSLLSLLCLIGANFLRARGPLNKGVVAAMATWALAFMALNAFRVGAPAFTIGMTCATFLLDGPGRFSWATAPPSRPERAGSVGR